MKNFFSKLFKLLFYKPERKLPKVTIMVEKYK